MKLIENVAEFASAVLTNWSSSDDSIRASISKVLNKLPDHECNSFSYSIDKMRTTIDHDLLKTPVPFDLNNHATMSVKEFDEFCRKEAVRIDKEEFSKVVLNPVHDNNHYDIGGISELEVTIRKFPKEWVLGWCVLNSRKYTGRCNYKGSLKRDLQKNDDYSRWASNIASYEGIWPPSDVMGEIIEKGKA